MPKVFVEGDSDTCELIAAAMRAAGLLSIDVEMLSRPGGVTPLPAPSGRWAALADLADDLSYADWRTEMLGLVDAVDRVAPRPVPAHHETVRPFIDLRRAG
jgi:hypothetical protein